MGEDNNSIDSGGYSLLDKFVRILDRQTDTKLSPTQLMGFLSLFNLLGVLDLMQGSADAGFKDVSTLANLTSLANKASKSPEGSAIKDALTGLLGQNQSGPNLGNLLNMIGGGNKKINPQMLLTLMTLLNSQPGAAKAEQHVPKGDPTRIEGAARANAGEVQARKNPDPNVELKFDKKKT